MRKIIEEKKEKERKTEKRYKIMTMFREREEEKKR